MRGNNFQNNQGEADPVERDVRGPGQRGLRGGLHAPPRVPGGSTRQSQG